ncbi:hypothetical protein LINPERPRIM_LOCUS2822 [Linum perenne]
MFVFNEPTLPATLTIMSTYLFFSFATSFNGAATTTLRRLSFGTTFILHPNLPGDDDDLSPPPSLATRMFLLRRGASLSLWNAGEI